MLKNRFIHMPDWLLKQIGLSHHLEGVVCYLAILLSRPLSLLSFSFFSFPFSSRFSPFLIPYKRRPSVLHGAAAPAGSCCWAERATGWEFWSQLVGVVPQSRRAAAILWCGAWGWHQQACVGPACEPCRVSTVLRLGEVRDAL